MEFSSDLFLLVSCLLPPLDIFFTLITFYSGTLGPSVETTKIEPTYLSSLFHRVLLKNGQPQNFNTSMAVVSHQDPNSSYMMETMDSSLAYQ